jgi:uncharacterized protein YdaU (DUF1376 family)
MGKDPAILFYSSDFLSGTAFMTMEQRGQYITLLCEQHQNGHIPEYHMLNICKSCDSIVFSKFIKDDNGLFFNERMEIEIIRRKTYSESRRKNKMSKSKQTYDSTYDSTYVDGMLLHMETETETDTINKDKTINSKKPKNKIFIPPLLIEVKEYFKEKGYDEAAAEMAFNFYDCAGWVDSRGNEVKNWKQKMISVWFKEENKVKKSEYQELKRR